LAHSWPDDKETSRSDVNPPINTATFGDVLPDMPTFTASFALVVQATLRRIVILLRVLRPELLPILTESRSFGTPFFAPIRQAPLIPPP